MPRTTNVCNKPPIGAMIGVRLKDLGKEQKWLSDEAQISQTYICAIINGRANPTVKTLRIIGNCLGIDTKELINALLDEKS